MGGIIHLILAGGGRPMSRAESDDLTGRVRLQGSGAAVARGSRYRSAGETAGAEAHDSATFAEVKRAWRGRAWRTSARWRRMFILLAGVALLTFGLFGMAVVLSPPGLKLVCAAALVYALVRTARGFARA